MKTGIYIIINPENKIYIGQSKNCNTIFVTYKRLDCKAQRRLYRSLKKYGSKNHSFELLIECNKEELNFWEMFYIKLFNCGCTYHGLNLTSGGHTVPELLSVKNLGNKYSLGKKHSAEGKKNHSLAVTGDKHPQFGIPCSEQVKNKISATTKGRLKPDIAKNNINKNHFRRAVNQLTLEGDFVKRWHSSREAENHGYNFSTIHNVCNLRNPTAYGYKWEYAGLTDEQKQNIETAAENFKIKRRSAANKRYYKNKSNKPA